MTAVFYPQPTPAPLQPDEAIVVDGDLINVTTSGGDPVASIAAVVDDSVLDDLALPATIAVVSDSQVIEVEGVNYTFTVVDGVITAIATEE